MATQIGGVTGRRLRSGRTEEVEEKAKYLPSMYAARSARDYQDAQMDLSRDRMAQDAMYSQRAMDQQEAANQRANRLGIAGLGAEMGLGLNNYFVEDAPEQMATDTATAGLTGGALDAALSGNPLSGDAGGGGIMGALGDTGKWSDALGRVNTYSSLLMAPAGAELGARILPGGGNDSWKRIAGGAGAAALSNLASGGDLYSSTIDAVLGGGIGALFG